MLIEQLSLGVLATSGKEDEHRLPIHPRHMERIDADLRRRIFLERGYGARYGAVDAELAERVGGLRSREQLIAECDVIVLPKPLHADVAGLRPGQVLWGWPHCVQDVELTQISIDRRLTVIAWEAMNHWTRDGAFSLHVFHKNNELAGYCSVMHALQLRGTSGQFGAGLRAAVISFGATARGAVAALLRWAPRHHGAHASQRPGGRRPDAAGATRPLRPRCQPPRDRPEVLTPERGSLAEYLARHDIVVNCILQDTDDPLLFVAADELGLFPRGTLIVDVSCDEGMGFEWARPTSFAEPMFTVGPGVHYYAVDHSPSYLWNSATWEISEALIPHIRAVMSGPSGWEASETIRRAIEIRDGVISQSQEYPFIPAALRRVPAHPDVSPAESRARPPAARRRPSRAVLPGRPTTLAAPRSRRTGRSAPQSQRLGGGRRDQTAAAATRLAWQIERAEAMLGAVRKAREHANHATADQVSIGVPAFAFLLGWADRSRAPRRARDPESHRAEGPEVPCSGHDEPGGLAARLRILPAVSRPGRSPRCSACSRTCSGSWPGHPRSRSPLPK